MIPFTVRTRVLHIFHLSIVFLEIYSNIISERLEPRHVMHHGAKCKLLPVVPLQPRDSFRMTDGHFCGFERSL